MIEQPLKMTNDEIEQRRALTSKLKDETLTYDEAIELGRILKKENVIASHSDDLLVLSAIYYFQAILRSYKTDLEDKKKAS